MTPTNGEDTLLGPYRVLDLTDANGLLCAKLLGDMGADVIKVERPGGDEARNRGPFFKDEVDPEKSLYWYAFNLNKRGITLNLETEDGRQLFRRLARTADFVVESYPVGYLDSLGLGYKDLAAVNPGLILVSLTAFGQTGPYAHYKAPDIVAWAMGGIMNLCGDPDRPPVRIGFPQSWLHACGAGAVGAMTALWHRELTGEGQQVTVSTQECATWIMMNTHQTWDLLKINLSRAGTKSVGRRPGKDGGVETIVQRQIFPVSDGFVQFSIYPGPIGATSSQALVSYMDQEGAAPDNLKAVDWLKLDAATWTQEDVDGIEKPIGEFLVQRPNADVYEEIVKRRMIAAPVSTAKDVVENRQLAERQAWVEIEHPELGEKVKYPGEWAKILGTPLQFRRRAPLIGEHNVEIYGDELGLSREQLAILKGKNVI